MPTIQEEVEDLEPVKIIEQRTRGKKYVGLSGSIPVQPKISKKKRTSVRKLRESQYILQEEKDVEASGLVTREIRNKKAADAVALKKAMQIAGETKIHVSSILREDAGVSAQKVIEAAEEVQELASAEAGNLLKMLTEIQRVKASGIEEQASDDATEDHQGKDSIHNARENIADPELSPLSSSTYTSSTPSPSNLNSSGEYVSMVPSVQERIDKVIQRHIDVGQRLPEGHWGRPDSLNPIQLIALDSEIPTTSTSTEP